MRITEGHLTASEKKVVKYFLQNNLSEGRVGKKNYFISEDAGVYTVKIQVIDRGLIPCPGSKLRLSTYTHKLTM